VDARGRVAAVLQAVNKRGGGHFSALDEVLLGLLASQAAALLARGREAEEADAAAEVAETAVRALVRAAPALRPLSWSLPLPVLPRGGRFTLRGDGERGESRATSTLDAPLAWVERLEEAFAAAMRSPGCRLFVVDGAGGLHGGGRGQSLHELKDAPEPSAGSDAQGGGSPVAPATADAEKEERAGPAGGRGGARTAEGRLWWSDRDL